MAKQLSDNTQTHFRPLFDRLPEDCIEHLYGFLPVSDLCMMAKSYPQHNEINMRSFRVAHNRTLSIKPGFNERAIDLYGEHATRLEIIERSWANMDLECFEPNKFLYTLEVIDQNCFNITSMALQFNVWSMHMLSRSNFFVYGASKITELSLVVPYNFYEDYIIEFLSRLDNLRTLNIFFGPRSGTHVDMILHMRFKHLQKFSYSCRSEVARVPDEEEFALFLLEHKKLEMVAIDSRLNADHLAAIRDCHWLKRAIIYSDEVTPDMLPILPQLPIAELGVRNVSPKINWSDVLQIKGLTELTVSHNVGKELMPIVDRFIAAGQYLDKVTKIRCITLHDADFEANLITLLKLVRILPNLKVLEHKFAEENELLISDEFYRQLVDLRMQFYPKRHLIFRAYDDDIDISKDSMMKYGKHVKVDDTLDNAQDVIVGKLPRIEFYNQY